MPPRRLAAATALSAALAACAGDPAPPQAPTDEVAGPRTQEPTQEPTQDPNQDPAPARTTATEPETASEPASDPPATPRPVAPSAGPVDVVVTTVATGLEAPWGLAFLPDGRALVTERDSGRLLAVDEGGAVTEVQRLAAAGSGEGGLLGVAVSPEDPGLVYAYTTTAQDNRVVRFRLGEEPEPVLTGIPAAELHNGGRIAFGPDGMLYVGTGDAREASSAPDPGSLAGKILRLTPDGGVPEDNPTPGSPVYSSGHRNVQGLAWDDAGRLYASEFGQSTFDEVNLVEPGGDYGWPEVEGTGGAPEYVDPITTFDTAEASPSGVAILADGAIPQWEGDLFMAALRGERLWRLDLDDSGAVVGREELLSGEAGRLRHVAQAPDGSLWVLTSNRDGRGDPGPDDDRILRLGPVDQPR